MYFLDSLFGSNYSGNNQESYFREDFDYFESSIYEGWKVKRIYLGYSKDYILRIYNDDIDFVNSLNVEEISIIKKSVELEYKRYVYTADNQSLDTIKKKFYAFIKTSYLVSLVAFMTMLILAVISCLVNENYFYLSLFVIAEIFTLRNFYLEINKD